MSGPWRRIDVDFDDFDEVEVERLLAGDRRIPLRRGVPLTPEAVETVRRLIARGMNNRQVSERLGGRLSPGAVLKLRNRYGIQPSREAG